MNRVARTFRKTAVWIAALALLTIQPGSVFAGDQDFTLHNSTGYTIAELYVSSADTNDWEEDVLGRDTLAANESLKITFPRRENAEKWDMKVVFDDGEEGIWQDLLLTEITDVTISYRDGQPYAITQNGD